MPMRGELNFPRMRSDSHPTAEHDAWAIIGCCAISLLMWLYFVMSSTPLDQIPVLIAASAW
jgi:hypothetical protein